MLWNVSWRSDTRQRLDKLLPTWIGQPVSRDLDEQLSLFSPPETGVHEFVVSVGWFISLDCCIDTARRTVEVQRLHIENQS